MYGYQYKVATTPLHTEVVTKVKKRKKRNKKKKFTPPKKKKHVESYQFLGNAEAHIRHIAKYG